MKKYCQNNYHVYEIYLAQSHYKNVSYCYFCERVFGGYMEDYYFKSLVEFIKDIYEL